MTNIEQLEKRYRKYIYSIAYNYLKDRDEAEDITQEVILKLIKNIDNIGVSTMKGWLAATTQNRVIDFFRQKAKAKEWKGTDDFYIEKGYSRILTLIDFSTNLKKLSPRQQLIMHAKVIEEMDYEEIADYYGISEITVRTCVSKARTALKQNV